MNDNRDRYIIEIPNEEPWKLDQDPMNSDETEIEIGRAKLTYGMFGTIANNLEFPGPLKEKLERAYQTYGLDAEIKLSKFQKHPITDEWQLIYSGSLNLSERRIEKNIFSCDYLETGLRQTLISQQKEKFEVDRKTDIKNNAISPLNTDILTLQGRKIYLLSRLEATDNFSAHTGIWRPNSYEYREAFRPFPVNVITNNDPLNIQPAYETTSIDNRWQKSSSNMFFASADRQRGRTKMIADINFTIGSSRGKNIRNEILNVVFDTYDENLNRIDREILAEFGYPFDHKDERVELPRFEKILNPPEGVSYALGIQIAADVTGNFTSEGYMEVDFYDVDVSISWAEDSYFRPTTTKVLTAYDLGRRLTEIYTGKPAFVSKTLSEGKWKDLLFTCGFWLRNMNEQINQDGENDERTLTINWDDYHNSLNALEPMAYGIVTHGAKQFIAYEKRSYFFQPYVTVELSQPTNIVRNTASELAYTSIKVGFQKGGNYERPLGLDEYNIETNYTLPITKHENKYDSVSPSRGDGNAIEDCRRKQAVDFPEEDTAYDKDNFMIHAKKTGSSRGSDLYDVRLWPDNFEQAPTGVYSPETAFNLTMSPGNIKEDHAIWYNGASSKYPDRWLMYANTEGNVQLTTKYPGKPAIKENENRLIKDLKKPIHAYDWIEFDHPFSPQLLNKIQGKTQINGEDINNWYGKFQFRNENGQKETGYLFSVKIKSNNMRFKLLKAHE